MPRKPIPPPHPTTYKKEKDHRISPSFASFSGEEYVWGDGGTLLARGGDVFVLSSHFAAFPTSGLPIPPCKGSAFAAPHPHTCGSGGRADAITTRTPSKGDPKKEEEGKDEKEHHPHHYPTAGSPPRRGDGAAAQAVSERKTHSTTTTTPTPTSILSSSSFFFVFFVFDAAVVGSERSPAPHFHRADAPLVFFFFLCAHADQPPSPPRGGGGGTFLGAL